MHLQSHEVQHNCLDVHLQKGLPIMRETQRRCRTCCQVPSSTHQ